MPGIPVGPGPGGKLQIGNTGGSAKQTKKLGDSVADSLDPFKGLNLGNWILRIGEIVLGVVLIGVGVAKMTGVENQVYKAAKTAGKAAMFL